MWRSRGVHAQRERFQLARAEWVQAVDRHLVLQRQRVERLGWQLDNMSPQQVLERGYALLQGPDGQVVTSAARLSPEQEVTATLADGQVKLTVR
jgi:exodeoxyribonuclease VII large subunit